jgi:beta-phosphoglucomutase-like phosphatase (HAD superfamily)
MTLPAAVFDVDGTLADTERDGHRVAFNAAFAKLGLPSHWDEALHGELLRVAGGVGSLRHCARDHLGQAFADDVPEDLLRRGLRLAIATTTSHGNVAALLSATLGADAWGWFDVVATAQDVPVKKPDPAVCRGVLERLALPAGAAVAFEDSAQGRAAATAAGVRRIVTPTACIAGDDFTAALRVVEDLEHYPDGSRRAVTIGDVERWHAQLPATRGCMAEAPASTTVGGAVT